MVKLANTFTLITKWKMLIELFEFPHTYYRGEGLKFSIANFVADIHVSIIYSKHF